MWDYLVSSKHPIDVLLILLCIISAVVGCLLPRTQDIFLEKKYGSNNHLINILRESFRLLWLVSGILVFIRAVAVFLHDFPSLVSIVIYTVPILLVSLACPSLANKIEERWHGKHKKDMIKIAEGNPAYRELRNRWNGGQYSAIVILPDRAIFLNNATITYPSCADETVSLPVSSDSEASAAVDKVAFEWKTGAIQQLIQTYSTADYVMFSALKFHVTRDITVTQLGEILAEELGIAVQPITKSFNFSYTHTYSYWTGAGATLRQATETKTYTAVSAAIAASIVYRKPAPAI